MFRQAKPPTYSRIWRKRKRIDVIKFSIGIHNHQPVGNFDEVFREAMGKAYLPFLEILERHPGVKVSIHNSGILYEWFEKNGTAYIDLLAKLVERGQVELITGGFYEPILPAIPERDGIGQIRMLSSYIEKRFHTVPIGFWTAERVWEPYLPLQLNRAGVRYTMLDDYHFRAAGLSESEISGYYLTEHEGKSVAVFPISKDLRYIIPFKQVDEGLTYLRDLAETHDGSLIVFADDGEKFGIWPGTYEWVIKEGWLEKFFFELEKNSDWLQTLTFKEALETSESSGMVYLPTASYHEMMEWALFDEARVAFHEIEEELKAMDLFDRLDKYAFLRGGLWRNFLAKYPEANLMHKKMMRVSDRIESISTETIDEDARSRLHMARKKLWAGQCNCPYWHGVFGGLYLPHLRSANYSSLLEAENIADGLMNASGRGRMEFHDFNGDGKNEAIVESRDINIFVSPDLGAGVMELDYRPLCVNLMDIMRRKVEPYHNLGDVDGNGDDEQGEAIPSIHEIVTDETVNQADVIVDSHTRLSFIDRFIGMEVSYDDYRLNRFSELGDFAYKPYKVESCTDGEKFSLSCSREAHIEYSGRQFPYRVKKRYELVDGEALLRILVELQDLASLDVAAKYGIEFSIGEIAGNADDRYMSFQPSGTRKKLGTPGEEEELHGFQIMDEWRGLTVDLAFSLPVTLWHYPIETFSQREGGFEMIYQGTVFLAMIPVGLDQSPNRSVEITMCFHGRKGGE
jgi:alpha-amylase